MAADKRDSNGIIASGSTIAFVVGFFYAFRLAITILSMNLFGADPSTGSVIRLGVECLLFIAVCFTSLGFTSRLRWLLKASSVRWVLVFLTFSACSLLWSETASTGASTVYWCATAADVGMVILLLGGEDKLAVASKLMKGFIWGAVAVGCIAWLMPTQYDLRLGDETFFSANSICNVCVFAVFFAQYLMRQRGERMGLITLFLILTALRSLSKTTIAAFLISEAYLLIQDRSMNRRTKLLLSISAVVVILMFWGLFEAYYDFYTTNGNQAETITGRTAIWAYVVSAVPERLWVGHGFDSMWNVVPAFGTFEARHAENEVLEQLYSYGIAGLVILAGVYGSFFRSIRRFADSRWRTIGISVLLFVVFRGIAEAEPFDLLLPLWAVALFSALLERPEMSDSRYSVGLDPHRLELDGVLDSGF